MATELETVAAVAAGDHDDGLQRSPATAPVPIPGRHPPPMVPDRAVGHAAAVAAADGASPASGSSHSYSLNTLPSLAKSNSTASAGAFSLTSHISIPVTGALPYGSLQVVQPPDESSLKTPSATAAAVAAARPPPPRSTPGCLQSGDVFLVLGLPGGFTVGCDTVALTTKAAASGPEFLGFRDLPPGPHFIWISEPNALTRSGYWFVTKSMGDVRVKQVF